MPLHFHFAKWFFFFFHSSTLCNCCHFNIIKWYNFLLFFIRYILVPLDAKLNVKLLFWMTIGACQTEESSNLLWVLFSAQPFILHIFYNKYLCALIDAVFLFECVFFLSGSFVSFYCIVKSSFIFLSRRQFDGIFTVHFGETVFM